MKVALCLATILTAASCTPNGFYHQQYNYKTSSASFKNNELQHKTDDEGFYSKDGDLEGRMKPKVSSNSEHLEYVNPDLRERLNSGYYEADADLTSNGNLLANSYGAGYGAAGAVHAGSQYGSDYQSEGYASSDHISGAGAYSGYGFGSQSAYGSSNLQTIASRLEQDIQRDIQEALTSQYRYSSPDLSVLEASLRSNLTSRLQQILQEQFGTQTIQRGLSYTLSGGRLQARPNYEQQELENLKRQMEQNLLQKLRTSYQIHQSSSSQNYARYQSTTTYRPTTYRTIYPNLNAITTQRPFPVYTGAKDSYQSYQQSHSANKAYSNVRYTPVPNPLSITTIASNVQNQLDMQLNQVLDQVQRRFFQDNSAYASYNLDSELEKLRNDLRNNLTYALDQELRSQYGSQMQKDNYMYSVGSGGEISGQYNYNVADLENLRRQVENNLVTKLNRDFEAARQRWISKQRTITSQRESSNFQYVTPSNIQRYEEITPLYQNNDYYRPTAASIIPLISTGIEGRNQYHTISGSHQSGYGSSSNLVELQRQLQTELSRQLQAAISQNRAYTSRYSTNFEDAYQRLYDDLQRNLTQQLQQFEANSGVYANSYGVNDAQLANMKSQLQSNLASQLQTGLRQSFSASSSYSASSGSSGSGAYISGMGGSYRAARGSDAYQAGSGQYKSGGSFNLMENCQDDYPNTHYRSKRSYGYRSRPLGLSTHNGAAYGGSAYNTGYNSNFGGYAASGYSRSTPFSVVGQEEDDSDLVQRVEPVENPLGQEEIDLGQQIEDFDVGQQIDDYDAGQQVEIDSGFGKIEFGIGKKDDWSQTGKTGEFGISSPNFHNTGSFLKNVNSHNIGQEVDDTDTTLDNTRLPEYIPSQPIPGRVTEVYPFYITTERAPHAGFGAMEAGSAFIENTRQENRPFQENSQNIGIGYTFPSSDNLKNDNNKPLKDINPSINSQNEFQPPKITQPNNYVLTFKATTEQGIPSFQSTAKNQFLGSTQKSVTETSGAPSTVPSTSGINSQPARNYGQPQDNMFTSSGSNDFSRNNPGLEANKPLIGIYLPGELKEAYQQVEDELTEEMEDALKTEISYSVSSINQFQKMLPQLQANIHEACQKLLKDHTDVLDVQKTRELESHFNIILRKKFVQELQMYGLFQQKSQADAFIMDQNNSLNISDLPLDLQKACDQIEIELTKNLKSAIHNELVYSNSAARIYQKMLIKLQINVYEACQKLQRDHALNIEMTRELQSHLNSILREKLISKLQIKGILEQKPGLDDFTLEQKPNVYHPDNNLNILDSPLELEEAFNQVENELGKKLENDIKTEVLYSKSSASDIYQKILLQLETEIHEACLKLQRDNRLDIQKARELESHFNSVLQKKLINSLEQYGISPLKSVPEHLANAQKPNVDYDFGTYIPYQNPQIGYHYAKGLLPSKPIHSADFIQSEINSHDIRKFSSVQPLNQQPPQVTEINGNLQTGHIPSQPIPIGKPLDGQLQQNLESEWSAQQPKSLIQLTTPSHVPNVETPKQLSPDYQITTPSNLYNSRGLPSTPSGNKQINYLDMESFPPLPKPQLDETKPQLPNSFKPFPNAWQTQSISDAEREADLLIQKLREAQQSSQHINRELHRNIDRTYYTIHSPNPELLSANQPVKLDISPEQLTIVKEIDDYFTELIKSAVESDVPEGSNYQTSLVNLQRELKNNLTLCMDGTEYLDPEADDTSRFANLIRQRFERTKIPDLKRYLEIKLSKKIDEILKTTSNKFSMQHESQSHTYKFSPNYEVVSARLDHLTPEQFNIINQIQKDFEKEIEEKIENVLAHSTYSSSYENYESTFNILKLELKNNITECVQGISEPSLSKYYNLIEENFNQSKMTELEKYLQIKLIKFLRDSLKEHFKIGTFESSFDTSNLNNLKKSAQPKAGLYNGYGVASENENVPNPLVLPKVTSGLAINEQVKTPVMAEPSISEVNNDNLENETEKIETVSSLDLDNQPTTTEKQSWFKRVGAKIKQGATSLKQKIVGIY